MAYNRPTSLRVPLSSVIEWSGKRTFTDIFKKDPRFETKKLGNTNELTANIYFTWKPDSLHLQEEETIEEEQESASTKRAKKGGKKGKASSRPSLGSPEKRKKARTRLQTQLEEKEVVVKREPGEDEVLIKEEKDIDDDLEFDLPDINNIINGRS
jgi:hypothetical protein